MKRAIPAVLILAVLASVVEPSARACTNFLITRGASLDGSTMITYAADSHTLYGELYFWPAATHPPGTLRDIIEWDTGRFLGRIPEAPATFSVAGNMNEHQLAIGESTWGGRPELVDPQGVVDYGSLMYIALQRARTAREAIAVMTGLVAQHGYASSGESFSICDPQEVWILELIGKGPGRKGAVWVARRIPDGCISGHANAARIRQFPLDDPQDTLYAPDVISFAREMGYHDGPDQDFSFADAYNPADFGVRRFCDARVWCMYQRAAPSQQIPVSWAEGKDAQAQPLPLWIRPDRKLSVADVMGLMRDHFQDTPLDMTRDVGAGPYRLPYRWRPLTWKVDGVEYFNERAVSTQQTGFSFVAQSRAWLPDPVGGVLWFGVDDTYTCAYFPVYAGVTEVPRNWAVGTGSFDEVTWDSAFWIFNQVSNSAYERFSDKIEDIQKVQRELEGKYLAAQAEVDAAAVALHAQSPRLAREYLTRRTAEAGAEVVTRWQELSKFLLYKYLDGNVKDELGHVTHPGYDEGWYQMVAAATGERLQAVKLPADLEAERARKDKAARTAEALLAVLRARGLEVDAAMHERILATEDPGTLEAWLVKAATAESAAGAME
ncbi:MAG: dipeptidase [Planctomycetes bacterium]|nr:dipeptidase [Planctomycetota bacterium]